MSLKEEFEAHNKKVKDAFDRAEKGEIIDLTELMISKEELELKRLKLDGLVE